MTEPTKSSQPPSAASFVPDLAITAFPVTWEAIWQSEGTPGWDIGQAAPPFLHLLAHPPAWLRAGTALAVFGCGAGHDAAAFARAGFAVSACDFAPSALATAAKLYGACPGLEFLELDVTAPPAELEGSFDYIVEHTCFCAIPPANRAAYAASAWRLLKPGGMIFGLFYRFETEPDGKGPPHCLDETSLLDIFSQAGFRLAELSTPTNSLPKRAGRERFARFIKP